MYIVDSRSVRSSQLILQQMDLKRGGPDERTIGGFNPQHLSDPRGFDGKRVRKAIQRRTIDYSSSIIQHLQLRLTGTSWKDYIALQVLGVDLGIWG